MQIPDNVLEIDEQSRAVQRAFPAHFNGTGRRQGGQCEVGAGLDREEAHRGGGQVEQGRGTAETEGQAEGG